MYTVDGIRLKGLGARTRQTVRRDSAALRGASFPTLFGIGGTGLAGLRGEEPKASPVVTAGLLGLLGVSVYGIIKLYGGGRR